jgi:nucleoside-diphosphate-sugar epimerase
MRVLVTGGAGFIGSAVARACVERGWETAAFDNLITGFESAVPEGVRLIRGDLRNLDAVTQACEGIDIVFHQAALRSVPRSVDDPGLTHACNVGGTLNVLIASEKAGVERVVYASSSSVYGDTDGALNREDMAPNPQSPYAASKLAGEYYCRVWTSLKGLSTVSLRYFNVYGPGQHPDSKYAAVFPAFISALTRGRAPEVHWDGEQSRDFSFIDDVVRANLLAAEADAVDGSVINIGGGTSRTVNAVLAAVSAAIGRWMAPEYRPKRMGDIRHTRADITRATETLEWKPETDWAESVERTLEWFANELGQ